MPEDSICYTVEQYDYKVTIGIPVYNVEKFIVKCLESVYAQSLDGIEILLVDDKGADGSMRLALKCIAEHSDDKVVRIVEHDENMGLAEVRNTIIREARGKYVFFLDSDDYLPSNSIELMYNIAEETGAETVWGSSLQVNIETGEEKVFWAYPDIKLFGEDQLVCYEYEFMKTRLLTSIWNILFITDFFRRHQLKFEMRRFEDTIMHYDMQPLINKAVLISNFTYCYVIRSGSLLNYQKRDEIDIQEAITTIAVSSRIKKACQRVSGKPYFPLMCVRIMKWSFFMACGLLKHQNQMTEELSNKSIMELMKYPASLGTILKMRKWRVLNFAFYFLDALPNALSIRIVKVLGKLKGVI